MKKKKSQGANSVPYVGSTGLDFGRSVSLIWRRCHYNLSGFGFYFVSHFSIFPK